LLTIVSEELRRAVCSGSIQACCRHAAGGTNTFEKGANHMKITRKLMFAMATTALCAGLASFSTTAARAAGDLPRVTFANIYPGFFKAAKPSFIYFCQSDKSLCDRQEAEIAKLSPLYPGMTFWRCDDPGEKAFAMVVVPGKWVFYYHDEPDEADTARILKDAEDQIN
jgi:hypothetical protein